MTSFFEQQELSRKRSRVFALGFAASAFAVSLCLSLITVYSLSLLAVLTGSTGFWMKEIC